MKYGRLRKVARFGREIAKAELAIGLYEQYTGKSLGLSPHEKGEIGDAFAREETKYVPLFRDACALVKTYTRASRGMAYVMMPQEADYILDRLHSMGLLPKLEGLSETDPSREA